MVLINLREQVEGGAGGPARAPGKGRGAGGRRDERVVAIQKLLLLHGLPISSKKAEEPDGLYGKVTNESLYRFANATHTDPKIKGLAISIKTYVDGSDYKKTLPHIESIANYIEGKDPRAEHEVPPEEREVYDLVIDVDGKRFVFPIMAAVRSVKNLDYMLRLYKFVNDGDPPDKKAAGVRRAVLFLSQHMQDPSWIGARTLLQDYGRLIEEGYKELAGGGAGSGTGVSFLDLVSGLFPIEFNKIPSARHREITSWFYSIAPKVISGPNIDARILKPKQISSFKHAIHKQLSIMAKQQSGYAS